MSTLHRPDCRCQPIRIDVASHVGGRRPIMRITDEPTTILEIVDEDAYRALVARVFSQPDRVVMGRETAAMASVRFHSAVVDALDEAHDETIAVVAHGVVISLFVARFNPIDPVEFWSGLGLPTAVLLDRDGFRLKGVIDTGDLDHVDPIA